MTDFADLLQQYLLAYVTEANVAIIGGTWALVELCSPLMTQIVMSQRLLKYRQLLFTIASNGKRFAALVWCSLAVWIPSAQPELCEPGVVDTLTCQTILERVATGVILGLVLSSGHWAFLTVFRRLTGRQKTFQVACANCGAKYSTADWEQACPACKQPPHELTPPPPAQLPEGGSAA